MEYSLLKPKDPAIAYIVKQITDLFGVNFFDQYIKDGQQYLIDFWDADLGAIGLKKNERLAYISIWGSKSNELKDIDYYIEFTLINKDTLDDTKSVKVIEQAKQEMLLTELELFFRQI